MKTAWIIIAIFFAYLAIGSVVVGIQIRIMKDLPDGDVVALLIIAWPIVLMCIVMRVFCDLAKTISGKDDE